jgi:hypothetical protein
MDFQGTWTYYGLIRWLKRLRIFFKCFFFLQIGNPHWKNAEIRRRLSSTMVRPLLPQASVAVFLTKMATFAGAVKNLFLGGDGMERTNIFRKHIHNDIVC